jgi:hypothetical protein
VNDHVVSTYCLQPKRNFATWVTLHPSVNGTGIKWRRIARSKMAKFRNAQLIFFLPRTYAKSRMHASERRVALAGRLHMQPTVLSLQWESELVRIPYRYQETRPSQGYPPDGKLLAL